jgi:hypothetical protein
MAQDRLEHFLVLPQRVLEIVMVCVRDLLQQLSMSLLKDAYQKFLLLCVQ